MGGVSANAEVLLTAGQQSSANSLPVVIANNQSAINISVMSAQTDSTGVTGTLSGTGQQTVTALNGLSEVNFNVQGTWVANAVLEASLDGTTFYAVPCINVATGAIVPAGSFITANGNFKINASGIQQARIRVAAYTSGTLNLVIRYGAGAGVVSLDAPVTQQPITKGTQGANGVTSQDLKDAGRNQTNYFMTAQVLSTALEALQSLTGYKAGAAVVATTTPAVVTAGKTYRINRIAITYIAVLTAGTIAVNLRANIAGLATLSSPIVDSWIIGAAAAVAGVAETIIIELPDGMEFAAGTGLAIGVIGNSATGVAAASGYAKVSFGGFEY